MEYNINKGVDRPLDFYGLKEQNIIYFAGGILAAIVIYFFIAFINQYVAIGVASLVAVGDYFACYFINNKYGVHGLAKTTAMNSCPERIQLKRVNGLLRNGRK